MAREEKGEEGDYIFQISVKLLNEWFPNLPRWVDRNAFYAEFAPILGESILTEMQEKLFIQRNKKSRGTTYLRVPEPIDNLYLGVDDACPEYFKLHPEDWRRIREGLRHVALINPMTSVFESHELFEPEIPRFVTEFLMKEDLYPYKKITHKRSRRPRV